MKEQSLYRDLALYYDLIYSFKDYKTEAKKVLGLITKYKKTKGKELLEVACGSGNYLAHFSKYFNCSGIDLNQGILNIARKKVKGATFQKADMVDFNLKKQFDVIVCLFSSIGYVRTYQNLKKTILNFAAHLKQGGVVIIEPWLTKEHYRVGQPHLNTYESKDLKIARLVVSKVRRNVSVMDMHYVIAQKNKEVKHVIDRHELGLFARDKTLEFMKQAGLKVISLKQGLLKDRGLFVGVKK